VCHSRAGGNPGSNFWIPAYAGMTLLFMQSNLPTINACLNTLSTIFLLLGFIAIKQRKEELHKKFMVGALVSSTLFLVCYLVYHYQVGSVPYPHHDWTRPIYFAILIPHVILAALMTPFIILAVKHAWFANYAKHKRIVRWLWPIWMYVSLSGVVIYLMLYVL
jgi:putative membrane protein